MAKAATIEDLLMQAKITNRLLAAPLKEKMGQKDLVKLLSSTGASASEIADILDTTPATINNTLQRLKKAARTVDAAPAAIDGGHNGGIQ